MLELEFVMEQGKLRDLESQRVELFQQLKASQPWKKYWQDDLALDQTVQFERVFQFGSIPPELISRMLARLHPLIEGDCVKRDCALLKNSEGTQAKVIVDILLNQFAIEIRAGSLEKGEEILKEIKEGISKVLNLYPQITVPDGQGGVVLHSQIVEGVRSPYSERVISLESIKNAPGKELAVDNEPAISVLKLKEMAGLVSPRPLIKKRGQLSEFSL